MVSQLIVLPCLVLQLHFCVHLYIYLGTTATLISPFVQKPFWIAIGYTLLMLWREKGTLGTRAAFRITRLLLYIWTQLSYQQNSNFTVLTNY